MNLNRRQFLSLTGAVGLLGVTGTASAAEPITDASVSSTDTTYATMGTNPNAPVATLLGNFKCPFTRDFVENDLDEIVTKFVEPGYLQLRYRQLAYEPYPSDPSHGTATYFISSSDPRIGRVALGVWDVDPDSYWPLFKNLFDDQPSGWVTYGDMRARMNEVGVSNQDRVIELAKSDRYHDRIRATTTTFHDFDVHHTPRFSLGGEVTNPRWNLVSWLNERIDTSRSFDGGSGDGSSGGSDGSNGSDGGTRHVMSVVGTGPSVEYEFAVSGSIDPDGNVESNDDVSASDASGTVRWMSDNYHFTGEITAFDVDGADDSVDIWVDGSKYAPSDFGSTGGSDGSTPTNWREMSVVGTGDTTDYRFTVSGGVEGEDNVESSDDVGDTAVEGTVKWMSDNYRIAGEMTSFEVLSGDDDVDIWIAGSKYAPSDF